MADPHLTLGDRFWSKVRKGDGCWEWLAGRSQSGNGYGRFRYEGVDRQAHRVVWEVMHGPIAYGLDVCHHCDNRACVAEAKLAKRNHIDNDGREIRAALRAEGPAPPPEP